MIRQKSYAELAVSGGVPTFAEALHVGRPNVGDPEGFLAMARGVLERNWLTNGGPLVGEFERKVADYVGVKHCIAMCNATIALEIATRALGMQGEVIVPSYTFIATAHALSWQGITPIFADIDPATHNLDPKSVRSMITPRTSGIVGVHLWGRASPVEELEAIANEHGLALLFDAAHAFGCSYKNRSIGQFGRAEVFSFHATKFFNTFEGGAVVTNDDELMEKIRLMRNFGFSGNDNVIHPGTNGKMTEVCAAMGLSNFSKLEQFFTRNAENYRTYRDALAGVPGVSLLEYPSDERSNHQYIVVEVEPSCGVTRNDIVKMLEAENVLARRYFWPGCHRMKPYAELYPHAGLVLPRTEEVARRVVVLPTGIAITQEQIRAIVDLIRIFVAGKS